MIRIAVALLVLLSLVACGPPVARTTSSPAADTSSSAEWRGMFIYLADAASFEDCASGTRYPVAMEGDYLSLERAYTNNRRYNAEPLLVMVRGHLATRPGMEGDLPVTHLIVDEYLTIYPGETCGNSSIDEQLEDMYWKLTRLEGEPVQRYPDQREPHLVLHSGEERLAGSGGCNRLLGGYELDGEIITFQGLATTRMACPQGQDQEDRFVSVLADVRYWRIDGAHLELLGPARERLARFEASPLQ